MLESWNIGLTLLAPDFPTHFTTSWHWVNCREVIVLNDKYRDDFVATLDKLCEKTGWEVFASVLMNNHFHLALRTSEPNLVDGIWNLLQCLSTSEKVFRVAWRKSLWERQNMESSVKYWRLSPTGSPHHESVRIQTQQREHRQFQDRDIRGIADSL